MENGKKYIAIDLKSFYASVECVERGLDPLTTNLVVADPTRTEKTICLAVSPSLKAFGIPGRARLFEVVQKVKEVNASRRLNAPGQRLTDKSYYAKEINANPMLEVEYIVAPPQMKRYMEVSTKVYDIYLKYIAPEDIHVYSIDEVFMDVTNYLTLYGMTPHELAMKMIHEVLKETGVTATAGIGTNLYLCKIAMDIVAKHIPPDEDGVRIAELDEMSYRRLLWDHRPLTDFWRVGRGYRKKLEANGLFTMGDIARCSLGDKSQFHNEDLLYKLFGINAELLIDHAWGWEPATIADIKGYKPTENSLSQGQVLKEPYSFDKGRLIVREMTDLLVLDIVEKGLVTDQMVLTVGYDIENLSNPELAEDYKGEIVYDFYGRAVPKAAHGSINLSGFTSSTTEIMEAVTVLYERIVDRRLSVRRMYVVANHVKSEKSIAKQEFVQLDLFTDYEALELENRRKEEARKKENSLQRAMIDIKNRYGKNAMLKGMNFEEGAMTIERNGQVGGHKA
ncbi:MAG: DNA methylase [Lachnospiraceae bacterium]|nr:DNA methylase [Lachnospiraceae bacterium]